MQEQNRQADYTKVMVEVIATDSIPSVDSPSLVTNMDLGTSQSHPTESDECPEIRPAYHARQVRRSPKFIAVVDLIIARVVCAAKAHISGYGKINKLFAQAAHRANNNK